MTFIIQCANPGYLGDQLEVDFHRQFFLENDNRRFKFEPTYDELGIDRQEASQYAHFGVMYLLGKDLPRDHAESFYNFWKGAEKGNRVGLFYLGLLYEKGIEGVVKKDFSQALEYFKMSAVEGYPQAYTKLGLILEPSNKKCALKMYKRGALAGDSTALCKIGFALLKGEGVQKDEKMGLTCIVKAMKLGNIVAKYKLCLAYQYGHFGLKQDLGIAARLKKVIERKVKC